MKICAESISPDLEFLNLDPKSNLLYFFIFFNKKNYNKRPIFISSCMLKWAKYNLRDFGKNEKKIRKTQTYKSKLGSERRLGVQSKI